MELELLSKSKIGKIATEEAIDLVKSLFSEKLSKQLDLKKISAPIIVLKGTGINDDLNGVERPVELTLKSQKAEVVQSLAKWKRLRLMEYDVPQGQGIITDMRAIRPDEVLSPLHSIYVDQWDWEKSIFPYERNLQMLKDTVKKIYEAIKFVEYKVFEKYPDIIPILPDDIKFIHTEELVEKYPDLTSKQRELEISKKYGAVFIIGIGGKLADGKPHDGRAPDYDDWSTITEDGFKGLNGDIIVWNPVLEQEFELSSMGIRVDKEALLKQLKLLKCENRQELYFHQLLLTGKLPESIGGGIGQSRLCMFLLRKKHIGEVQVSVWDSATIDECHDAGIELL